MSRSDVRGLDGVGPWLAKYLPAKLDLVGAATRLAEAASLGAAPLGLTDPGYPHRLRAIYDPPSILFVTGDPQAFQGVATLAIVGARRASQHGTEMAQRLGAELVQAGVAVISGLAYGIDGVAHRGALAGHGKTVAVLASGSDKITPAAHTTLAHEIVAGGGALVSEYPPGTEAQRGHFPARNRIVSGLADGVVVVEAGVRSGALITAEFALEQGRTVFAVPGRPSDATAAGALELLREGAAMVVGSDDVLEELGWVRTRSAAAVPPLTGSQRKALDLVRRSQPASFDGLLEGSGMPAPELLALLGTLELIGVVYRSGSGRWQTSETGTTGGSTR